MTWLQFWASLVQSLAWPTAVVLCVWIFKERLQSLLPLLRLRYKELDVSFRLEKAEQDAAALPPPPQEPPGRALPPPTVEEQQRHNELAELHPVGAIAETSLEVEGAMRHLAEAAKLDLPPHSSMLNYVRLLRHRKIIDSKTAALADDLRVIRNNAMHQVGSPITTDDAKRYRALAEEVIKRLQILTMMQ